MARAADFDLTAALGQKNFTPGQKHIPGLVDLIAAGNDRAAVALATLGGSAFTPLFAKLRSTTDDAVAMRLVSAMGLLARGGNADATLVLVNGRRVAVSSFAESITTNFVDINSIPVAAIERMEIVKDGASAVYGSDAVAGVVNVILRKDFEGIAVEVS